MRSVGLIWWVLCFGCYIFLGSNEYNVYQGKLIASARKLVADYFIMLPGLDSDSIFFHSILCSDNKHIQLGGNGLLHIVVKKSGFSFEFRTVIDS